MSEYNSSDQSEGEASATPATPTTPCPPISQNGDIEYVGSRKGPRQFLVVDHTANQRSVPLSVPYTHWILTPCAWVSLLEKYRNFTRPSTRDQFEDLKVPKLGSKDSACNLSHPIPSV
jgi:hypothetical protein